MIQVQPYQARLPMHSGGGFQHLNLTGMQDLRREPGANPIVEALQQILEQKQQKERDELNRRLAETNIAYRQKATDLLGQERPISDLERQMGETNLAYRQKQLGLLGQPKPVSGKIIVSGGKTWLVNPQTGEKTDLGIPAPKGQISTDLIRAWQQLGQYEEATPQEKALRDTIGQQLMGQAGLEEYEEEIPGVDRQWPIPNIPPRTEKRYRKKVESREVPKTPITEALEQTQKMPADMVHMQAPDGEKYLVPAAKVKEAKQHGWKPITAPANLEAQDSLSPVGAESTVPSWLNLGKRSTGAETAKRLGVTPPLSAAAIAEMMGVSTEPRPGSVGATGIGRDKSRRPYGGRTEGVFAEGGPIGPIPHFAEPGGAIGPIPKALEEGGAIGLRPEEELAIYKRRYPELARIWNGKNIGRKLQAVDMLKGGRTVNEVIKALTGRY